MFVIPNLTNMNKQLQPTVWLAAMTCLLFISCTAEPNEPNCGCEEATYLEEKYQDSSQEWLLNRVETNREAVECQDETDFIRTGNGTEVKRIECNN